MIGKLIETSIFLCSTTKNILFFTFFFFIYFSVAPSVRAPSQLLGAPLGSDVQLNCQVEASPAPVSYWLKGGRMPTNTFTGGGSGGSGGASSIEIAHPRPEMLLDG